MIRIDERTILTSVETELLFSWGNKDYKSTIKNLKTLLTMADSFDSLYPVSVLIDKLKRIKSKKEYSKMFEANKKEIQKMIMERYDDSYREMLAELKKK